MYRKMFVSHNKGKRKSTTYQQLMLPFMVNVTVCIVLSSIFFNNWGYVYLYGWHTLIVHLRILGSRKYVWWVICGSSCQLRIHVSLRFYWSEKQVTLQYIIWLKLLSTWTLTGSYPPYSGVNGKLCLIFLLIIF